MTLNFPGRRGDMNAIVKSAKLHWRFYREFLNNRYFNVGLAAAAAAYAVRAAASGMFIPYSLQEVTNGLFNRSSHLLGQGLLLLALSGVIYAASEWGFKPFFQGIARSISLIKIGLVNSMAPRNGGERDRIGRLVNDVDFVMWNVGGIINSMFPNALTAFVAEMTLFEMSPLLGLIGLVGLPIYIAVLEHYVRGVHIARAVERRAYGESIQAASEYMEGRAGPDAFIVAMEKWLRGIDKNIHLDRVYWSISFGTGYAVPAAIALVGVDLANKGKLSIGSLVGSMSAALTMYTALVNAFWAICLLGQNAVVIDRVFSMRGPNGQRSQSPAQPLP